MTANRNIIIDQLQSLTELNDWADIISVFQRTEDVPHPDWEIPILACQAVGGQPQHAYAGAAAVACLQISIMLVDDMLDEDPRGEHLRRGTGPTANLALAFQAASTCLLANAPVAPPHRLAAINSLAKSGLATAYGQALDVQNFVGEENYWRVVEAKSTPFYGAAYEVGAYLGGASVETAVGLYHFGTLIGELIQIEDDLTDAFATPANADWHQGRNNLLLLYASTVDHPAQNEFKSLQQNIENPQSLVRAQTILIESGAVSYAVYQLITRYQEAQDLIASLNLAQPQFLLNTLSLYGGVLIDRLAENNQHLTTEELQSLLGKQD